MANPIRRPGLVQALLPMFLLVVLLAVNVVVFGDEGLDGPNQFVLLIAAGVAMFIGSTNGHRYEALLEHVVRSISTAMGAVLTLLLIGALAGSWLIGGIVPAMVHHGLLLLSPEVFLVAACLVCAVVSLATGSSWSTVATVGIALMGIGKALGLHEGWVAGAVISGAYFGDKLSPLSDTTNLAPAVAGAGLFEHIRYMLNTTVPSLGIALLLFALLGLSSDTGVPATGLDTLHAAILSKFSIGWWSYLVPLTVLVLIWRRVPALPALFAGALLGGASAIVLQPRIIAELAQGEGNAVYQGYMVVLSAMTSGVQVVTGDVAVDELLTSGGMAGMLKTVWLVLCAMAFGGAMEGAGLLERITVAVMKGVRGDASLVAATSASCVLVNVTASDQYLSIALPGRMYAPVYRARGLAPKLLSRTLEDSGTVTSVLVPWNTCGAYMSGVLGVATMAYLPFCFFNLLSPVMTVVQSALGWRVARVLSKGGGSKSGS